MITNMFLEEQENFDIEVNLYSMDQTAKTYLFDVSNQELEHRPAIFRDFQFSHTPNLAPEFHFKMGKSNAEVIKKEWIGSGCLMVNKRRKCTVNWKAFVLKNPPESKRDSMYRTPYNNSVFRYI